MSSKKQGIMSSKKREFISTHQDLVVITHLLVKSFLLLHGVSPKRQNLFNLRGPVLEKLDMEVESP